MRITLALITRMYDIFIPKSEKLIQLINNFCIMKKFEGGHSYLAFPQSGTTLAFYPNSCISSKENCISITATKESTPQILVLGKYKLPLHLQYQSYSPEISINFTPTGLNNFFNADTGEIAKDNIQKFDDKKWLTFVNQLFTKKSNELKIDFLESFLLENLVRKDLSKVEKCVTYLKDNPNYPISTIANKMDVSARTINRWFANYIGCSPKDFKKIMRFRKAIDTKFHDSSHNLTRICLETDFYDSSHFTREFKKLTQMNPRDFFSSIDYVANKNIPYKFL